MTLHIERNRVLATQAPRATLLIRLALGGVFISEGVQKFLYPHELGEGRFAHIGIPAPHLTAPFVGCFEIACGLAFIVGLLVRPSAFAMTVNMLVAVATTKLPILVQRGFWAMAHEARTDYAMLLGAVFLLLVGGGAWSLDARLVAARGPKSG